MKPNLAAAVEAVRKDVQEAKDSSIVPHLVLTHINHLETILAELGTGAGEVTDERIQRASALAADLLDESERIAKLGNESSAFVYRSIAKALTAAIGRGDE